MPELTLDLLAELLDRAERLGHPEVTEALAPGLTDEQIDEIMRPTGLRLPPEARVLWRWRDGCRYPVSLYAGIITPSLEEAIERRTLELANAAEHWEGVEEEWWPESFFPVTASEDTNAIDCADPTRPLSPVHVMWVADSRHRAIETPRTDSIGEMVTWWIEAYDSGATWFDRDRGGWALDDSKRVYERRHIA